ncbi:hypothetical protein TREES_T100014307 [Tupaia chinensis]|uniref:Uncharacterized protein n=1 Tax=Tupaia chinensis TaxID=246437 RepID=L9JDY2_TUPCH|nr:hypothetical protein TREES_T100014307 [Tupaia chinensis]
MDGPYEGGPVTGTQVQVALSSVDKICPRFPPQAFQASSALEKPQARNLSPVGGTTVTFTAVLPAQSALGGNCSLAVPSEHLLLHRGRSPGLAFPVSVRTGNRNRELAWLALLLLEPGGPETRSGRARSHS